MQTILQDARTAAGFAALPVPFAERQITTMTEKIRLLYKTGKWYIFAAGAVIILGLALIITVLVSKPILLNGVLLGCGEAVSEEAVRELTDGFLEHLGMEPGQGKLRLVDDVPYSPDPETPGENFATLDALTEYTTKGLLDFLAGDAASMETLAYSDFFVDLRDVLTPEQLEALDGRLRYIDLAVVRQLEQMALEKNYPETFTVPDPAKPEAMAEPVPILVDVTGWQPLEPFFGDSPTLLAVTQNTRHPGTTREFLEYLARDGFRDEMERE